MKAREVLSVAQKDSVCGIDTEDVELRSSLARLLKPVVLNRFQVYRYKDGIYMYDVDSIRFLGSVDSIIDALERA